MAESEREKILNEIRRTAEANGGKPLGRRRFEQETGINPWSWGRYWSKFGDAQAEAGFERNALNPSFPTDHMVEKYVGVVRDLNKVPTWAELRLRRSHDPDFPDPKAFARFGGTKNQLVGVVLGYCADRPEYADVVQLLSAAHRATPSPEEEPAPNDAARIGFVYLIKGRAGEYKLGHTSAVDRRLSELATGSPVDLGVVHEIKTDDPLGVEAYWHRRFAEKRMKNEWFRLNAADVRAFKRWRRLY